MPANGLMHDGLAYWARRRPKHPALHFVGHGALSYADLARWSDGVAERLAALGIGPGTHVAIAAGNGFGFAAAALGILKAGATVCPFNDRLLGDELAYLAEYSEAKLIVADAARAAILDQAGVATPWLALEDMESLRGGASAGWQEVREDSSAAMIVFTSGSTDRPKGAVMGHGNYLAKFMEMCLLAPELGPDTRSLMPFGLHSSPGLAWGILFTTLLGGTLYFVDKYDAESTLCTLVDERITFFIGAPLIYEQVSRLPGFAGADFSALAFARVGGATPLPETLEHWREAGVVVRQLYGMTEVGGGAIIASVEEALARPDSCGRGLAFSRVRIVRDDGSAADPGEPGHIWLKGPGMMDGYWRQPEATAEVLVNGWMRTGDVGTVDADGYFRYLDRSKEMIKSAGFNVSPSEIEAVMARHEGVVEAAVFAVPDAKVTETACAVVCTRGDVDAQELVDFCAARLAGFKVPRYVVCGPDRLPRLANEKIDRRSLKARFAHPGALPVRLEPSNPRIDP